MHESLLFDIGKAVIGAALLGIPAFILRLPLLLAYIAAGVILGPHIGFGYVKSANSIATLSEIGLVLLMFILGLEIDLRKLLQAGRAVLINGFTQFTGCLLLALGFFAVLKFNNLGNYGLVYLAVASALSSTLIVVKILSDRMELDALPSRITLGVLVLQDLWAIGFLAIQPNLTELKISLLAISVSKVGMLVFVSWIFAKFVLPKLFARSGKQPELMLILAMAWCFAMCSLADMFHLSLEMGALVAGVSIAAFPYHVDIAAKVASLRDFFITLFFVSLGLRIPQPTVDVLILAVAIIGFVSISRLLTVFPVLHFMGYGNRASLLPTINLSQVSEFAIVLASLGVNYGHITNDILSAFIIAMVATALMSSLIIPKGHNMYKLINPLLQKLGFGDSIGRGDTQTNQVTDTHAKIILLGFYREASSLLYEMLNRYTQSTIEKMLVVDLNPEAHMRLKKLGVSCKYGDISNPDTLRHLHLEHATLLICTIPDHILKGITNLKLLKVLKALAPNARIIVTAESIVAARKMYNEGADYVFIPRLVGAFYLADVIERMQNEGVNAIKSGGMEYIKNRDEIIP